MTTAELSAETGVPPATIRKLAKDLGGRRDGRSYIFPKKAVQQLRHFLKETAEQKKSGQGNTRRKKGIPGWRTVRIRFQKKESANPLHIRFGHKDSE